MKRFPEFRLRDIDGVSVVHDQWLQTVSCAS
jgi:hypothetical protein